MKSISGRDLCNILEKKGRQLKKIHGERARSNSRTGSITVNCAGWRLYP
ncbi:MAG: hypothetical protein HZA08_09480 [Nitrospirae bacterium]|nr:hypothetical protein [Nitrospirota bacterium]